MSGWEQQLAQAVPKEHSKLWRELGVVGRLHNYVNAVCASHKRCGLFNEVQQEINNELLYSFNTLELRQDGVDRWNSVYLMLLRCLELKEHIKHFIRRLRPDKAFNNLDHTHLPTAFWTTIRTTSRSLLNFSRLHMR
jgi:hypothetical protein